MDARARTRFLANACHVCKSRSTPCPCGVCGMVFYCSPVHRRENWREHAPLCWALAKVGGDRGPVFAAFQGGDFAEFRHGVARRCAALLNRPLEPWEFELIYHPRVCDVCREPDWEKLQSCQECGFVYTCDKRHFRKDHRKWCKILKLYSDINSEDRIEDANVWFEIEHVRESMSDALSEHLGSEVEKAFASELLTYPLTVLSSLEAVGAARKRELNVLFIGAEVQAEVEPLHKWETFLLHHLEDVQVLSLVFLGPELRTPAREYFGDLCERCRLQKKVLRCEFVPGKFYHEYPRKGKHQADLICALNSGMYRDFGFGNRDSWQETVPELLSQGNPPVLVTEYTCRELQMDLEKIRRLCGGVAVLAGPGQNPFASLKPGLNIMSEDEAPVIFKNYFRVILQGA